MSYFQANICQQVSGKLSLNSDVELEGLIQRHMRVESGVLARKLFRPFRGPARYNPDAVALNPVLGDIDYRTNYGMGKYNALQAKLSKRYSRGLTGAVVWTRSHNMANTMGANSSTRPQNSNCFACEWGNLPEDDSDQPRL